MMFHNFPTEEKNRTPNSCENICLGKWPVKYFSLPSPQLEVKWKQKVIAWTIIECHIRCDYVNFTLQPAKYYEENHCTQNICTTYYYQRLNETLLLCQLWQKLFHIEQPSKSLLVWLLGYTAQIFGAILQQEFLEKSQILAHYC